MWSSIRALWTIFLHMFRRRVTIQYPEQKPYIAPRWRGRIILSRDPDGAERCVAADHFLVRTGARGQRCVDPGEGAVDAIERGGWRSVCHRSRIAWLHRGASLI